MIQHTGEQEGLHFQRHFVDQKPPFLPKTQYQVYPHVRAIFTDVDGVLTDGGFYYSEKGLAMKRFCTRDAAAVVRLKAAGYKVCAVTHSADMITSRRLEDMWFDMFQVGVKCKIKSIKKICEEYGLDMSREVIYIDDDVGGIPAMEAVAVSFCPADAAPAVLRHGRVCDAKGGEGVLAEVADLLLREYE